MCTVLTLDLCLCQGPLSRLGDLLRHFNATECRSSWNSLPGGRLSYPVPDASSEKAGAFISMAELLLECSKLSNQWKAGTEGYLVADDRLRLGQGPRMQSKPP